MSYSSALSKEKNFSGDQVLQAIIKSAHYLRHELEAGLSALGVPSYLTGPRLRLLMIVLESGKIRMSELATKMGIKAITVTQFVDALEKENLLVRTPDPNDRRATLLQLSNHAPPIIEKAQLAAQEVTEKLLEPLSMEMRGQLIDILSHLVDYQDVCVFDDLKEKSKK